MAEVSGVESYGMVSSLDGPILIALGMCVVDADPRNVLGPSIFEVRGCESLMEIPLPATAPWIDICWAVELHNELFSIYGFTFNLTRKIVGVKFVVFNMLYDKA